MAFLEELPEELLADQVHLFQSIDNLVVVVIVLLLDFLFVDVDEHDEFNDNLSFSL